MSGEPRTFDLRLCEEPTVQELAAKAVHEWLARAGRLERVVAWTHDRQAAELVAIALHAEAARRRPGAADVRVALVRLLAWALETIERLEDGCPMCGTKRTGWRAEPGVTVCADCERRARADLRSTRLELELQAEERRRERELQRKEQERARQARRAGAPACVYLIGAPGRVKVGIASDAGRRHRNLATQAGEPLELLRTWQLDRRDVARHVESSAHRELAEHRTLGEWFTCEPDLAAAAVERAIDEQERRAT